MSSLGFVIITGGLVIAVILIAFYIFPNIICNYIIAKSNDNNNMQQEGITNNNRNPLKDICTSLSLKK
jgi:hypothetical protein